MKDGAEHMLERARIDDEGFDAFGRDPALIARLRPLFDFLLDRVFQARIEGTEHLPREGRAILVCNHGGALPWDSVMLSAALERKELGGRVLRPLVEDAVMTTPFLGTLMTRLGAVRASQENAVRLLARGDLIAVFPEGMLGLGKRYRRRYKLMRFGRGGFVRLAVRTKTPILPVAILGAEDTAPLLFRLELKSRALGLPYLPITPLFPLLGPLGLIPLPARWALRIGEPIDVAAKVEDPDDDVAVSEMTARVREKIQAELRLLQKERDRVYPWSKAKPGVVAGRLLRGRRR